MSFQAYLDTIERQPGKSPAELRKLTREKGIAANGTLVPGTKATAITDWLKARSRSWPRTRNGGLRPPERVQKRRR